MAVGLVAFSIGRLPIRKVSSAISRRTFEAALPHLMTTKAVRLPDELR